MSTHTGYLLIADISGDTAYLTRSEMDHANPILSSLLEALVMQVGEPLHLWRMEGDAVLAYSTSRGFPSCETFLTICENGTGVVEWDLVKQINRHNIPQNYIKHIQEERKCL